MTDITYLALPTVQKNVRFGHIGRPFRIYAIPNVEMDRRGVKEGVPPYFRVVGIKDQKPELEELAEGSREFNRVRKWVGTIPHQRNERPYTVKSHRGRKAIHAGCRCIVDEEWVLNALMGSVWHLPGHPY